MIFVFLGVALVCVELRALAGRAEDVLLPTWARTLIPLFVYAVCWFRWPRERIAWAVLTIAVLVVFNRNVAPVGG